MSGSQKTIFGAMALAQGLHFVLIVLRYSGWLPAWSLLASVSLFGLIAWNLVLSMQASRRFPWAEPIANFYSMACAFRLIVFTCAVLLPLLRLQGPTYVGPVPVSVATSVLMHGFGLGTLLRMQRAYAS